MNTTLILKFTALTYLGLLAAGLLMPGVVGLRQHLGVLPKFIRQLFWVYYTFIGLSLVFVLVNLAVDLLYAVIDPRIEYR